MRRYHQLLAEAIKKIAEGEYDNLDDLDDFSGHRVLTKTVEGHEVERQDRDDETYLHIDGKPYHDADITVIKKIAHAMAPLEEILAKLNEKWDLLKDVYGDSERFANTIALGAEDRAYLEIILDHLIDMP